MNYRCKFGKFYDHCTHLNECNYKWDGVCPKSPACTCNPCQRHSFWIASKNCPEHNGVVYWRDIVKEVQIDSQ